MMEDRLCWVRVDEVIPGIQVDLRYAGSDNFTGRKLYDRALCCLRRPVAERLVAVQRELSGNGRGLLIWDAYRPLSVQRELWAVLPDDRYIADPAVGSRHNRGASVDLTLVDADGIALTMPTEYDDFSEQAWVDHLHDDPRVRANLALLQSLMVRHGFQTMATEWWHFDARDWSDYPVADIGLGELASQLERD
jgi:D-alanyl-D-alanine dipeptidase